MVDDFASLFRRAREGDRDALEGLLRRHLDELRAYVRLKCGPRLRVQESQSDIVQSVCREVLGDVAELEVDDEDAFRRWLFGVAYHKITHKAEYHGAQKRDTARKVPLDGVLEVYGGFVTPSRQAEVADEVERVERAFDLLPEEYRNVILQVCLRSRSHREVAAEMGRSEEALRKLLSRARARLALLMQEAG